MDWLSNIFAILAGFVLRLAIPIGGTALVVLLLKWLDERWKQDAVGVTALSGLARNIGCWEINGCPEDRRAHCAAFSRPEAPCWQVFRTADGRLMERCLNCDVFRHSPLPVTS